MRLANQNLVLLQCRADMTVAGVCAAVQSTLSSRATAQDWVLSGPGATCASVCPTSSAVLFRTFSGETARDTALCSASTPSGVWVIGYEEGAGCIFNANGTVETAEAYQCRCTEPNQKQGLALPAAEGTCEQACTEVAPHLLILCAPGCPPVAPPDMKHQHVCAEQCICVCVYVCPAGLLLQCRPL